MRLLQIYILSWFIYYSHSVILEMKFVKGRYLSHYGVFKFNVPTMYQCAELCQVLDVCQSITFDKSLQQCKLNSITWDIDTLTTDVNFIYAEKTNIPVVSIFRVCVLVLFGFFCVCFLFLFSLFFVCAFFWIYVDVYQRE